MAYLYRHIRPDTDSVFYVGVGLTDDNFARARNTRHRNRWWKHIYAKCGRIVEVILDGLSIDEAYEKEREFIKLYGRRDKGNGTLCNCTDGGEGVPGKTVIRTDEWNRNASLAHMKPVINTDTGEEYLCCADAAAAIGMSRRTLGDKLRGAQPNETPFRYNTPDGLKTCKPFSDFTMPSGDDNPSAKRVIDTKTGTIYGSVVTASIMTGHTKNQLYQWLTGRRDNPTNLCYETALSRVITTALS